MPVDPHNADVIKANYGNAVYYFCSNLCREKFAKHPVQFAALRKDRSHQ
jgi:YHS domain-containing protein